ncbi:MAG: sulfate respiration complex hexadecaheme cytochrome HmcA [Desulfovibrionaceae bacterium]
MTARRMSEQNLSNRSPGFCKSTKMIDFARDGSGSDAARRGARTRRIVAAARHRTQGTRPVDSGNTVATKEGPRTMEKGRTLLRWLGIMAGVGVISLYAIGAQGVSHAPAAPGDEERADVVVIKAMAAYGALDEETVVFLHDKHTEALQAKGKNCDACHKADDKGVMSPRFMRLADGGHDADMAIYHDNCIGCHKETAAAGLAAGPTEQCGRCHTPLKVKNARQPMGFDSSLHARHVAAKALAPAESGKTNCAACHHEYDKAAKKTVYVEGKEGTCRYCHKSEVVEETRTMEQASHAACIACHRSVKEGGADSGPANCAGCHAAAAQAKVKKLDKVERLKRKQPDATLVRTTAEADATLARMAPVPFDHAAHEGYVDSCRACHHASLDACGKCHTLSGSKDGAGVSLETSMHTLQGGKGCVGCHAKEQARKPECASCHNFLAKTRLKDDSCASCHAPAAAGFLKAEGTAEALKAEAAANATALLGARTLTARTYGVDDIPEFVEIGSLANDFKASKMPHRKIVLSLVDKVRNDKLAAAFHRDPGTLCQGCHHQSPASKTPPKCASCHGKPFNESDIHRPGLKAAYHQQCMGCHNAMGLEKPKDTACVECHEKKQ